MNEQIHYRHDGSVMVEFAGALVLLLLMAFGISEIGRAIYQLNTLTKAVKTGARYMSHVVGAVKFDPKAITPAEQCQTTTAVWSQAVEHATNLVLYGTESVGTVTRLPNMEVTSITAIPHLDAGLGDGGACIIKISARARFVSIFGDSRPIPEPLYNGGGTSGEGLVFSANAEERYLGE